jgi:2-oxoglutarate dehydrogenase E2 component (dihydrolipoamide succinyltransferase)
MKEIAVPSLGESIAEASIVKINKKVGDYIEEDEILLELETDKATMAVNSPSSGLIKEIRFSEGDNVEIGKVIAIIDDSVKNDNSATKKEASTSFDHIKENKELSTVKTEQNISSGPIHTKQNSPAANVLMENKGIDNKFIQGTGRDGRITKSDVLNSEHQSKPKEVNLVQDVVQNERIVPMSKLRQSIARRLKESQNTAAILTTFNEVDMHNVISLRTQYKELFEKKHGIKLGFMSFFVKAVIAGLQEFPGINAEIKGNDIIYKNYYNIGVAVGTKNGLVVPVIRNAEKLSMAGMEKEIIKFGKKASDGSLTPQDMQGGTFTISNGGIYGSLMSTPIINPPQSGILGMHSIKERPVVISGEIKIRPMMYLALSYDHRIVDGREAVTFLVRVKNYIENPERLILDV